MHRFPHLRRWLFYFGLAVPVIFLPQVEGRLNSSDLVFGVPGTLDILIGGHVVDGIVGGVEFQPASWLVFPAAVIWTVALSFAWRARLWAMARTTWVGAFVQALLTSLYCALIFFFLWNLVCLIWFWWCYSLTMPRFNHALVFARGWLPYLYATGATGILTTLFLDSRTRRGPRRFVHFVFALLLIIAFARLTPFVVWQLSEFDEMIKYSEKQNK
jgi:hypothetical protein